MLTWEWWGDAKAWLEPVRGLIATTILAGIGGYGLKKLKRSLPESLLKREPPSACLPAGDLAMLNRLYQGQALCSGPYFHEPVVEDLGAWELTAAEQTSADQFRLKLRQANVPNDAHAAITGSIDVEDDPVALQVRTMDYAVLKALRESRPNASWPRILSASALVIDAPEKRLILHRRSPKSATYPEHLHTIGGAYWPAMEGRDGDRGSVRNTALRETLEELNTAIAIRKETPLCLLQEVQTGFVQFVYLGCELFDSEYLKSNAEGKFTCVSFVNLADVLKGERRLVPTGEAAILMWLAMGAPGVDPDTRFSGRRPRQLFADICKERGASASQASARSD